MFYLKKNVKREPCTILDSMVQSVHVQILSLFLSYTSIGHIKISRHYNYTVHCSCQKHMSKNVPVKYTMY